MAIILNKHQQRRPFGGHHFPEQGMVVRAETWDELQTKVRKLRIINGHPEGNVESEILRYYAEHFPYMVTTGEEKGKPVKPSNYFKYRDWIRYLWFDPPKKLITLKEAGLRWDKCETCPRNVKKDWQEDDETAEFARRSFMLRCGLDVPDFLGFCDCHRWDLGLAVLLHDAEKVSNKAKQDNIPTECWVDHDKNSSH